MRVFARGKRGRIVSARGRVFFFSGSPREIKLRDQLVTSAADAKIPTGAMKFRLSLFSSLKFNADTRAAMDREAFYRAIFKGEMGNSFRRALEAESGDIMSQRSIIRRGYDATPGEVALSRNPSRDARVSARQLVVSSEISCRSVRCCKLG